MITLTTVFNELEKHHERRKNEDELPIPPIALLYQPLC